jgi:hypothetical protein
VEHAANHADSRLFAWPERKSLRPINHGTVAFHGGDLGAGELKKPILDIWTGFLEAYEFLTSVLLLG